MNNKKALPTKARRLLDRLRGRRSKREMEKSVEDVLIKGKSLMRVNCFGGGLREERLYLTNIADAYDWVASDVAKAAQEVKP